MKKVIFALVAASMTMTSCMNEEFPNAVQYGYINLNVSNDPTLQTRAPQNVTDIASWTIETQLGEGEKEKWSAGKAYTAGTYTVYAQSHANESDWKSANSNYGEAFYIGNPVNVTVVRGQSADAIIKCGRAKNAKLTVNITGLPEVFEDVKVIANRDESKTLVLNGSEGQAAFFGEDEQVTYSINYIYNNVEKSIPNQSITMAGAATNNIITITANANGLITVKITYDDSFGEGNKADITFDAATGNEVK